MNAKSFRSIIVPLFAIVLGTQQAASAHAFLDRAEPRVGSKVDKPPGSVRMWFTQQLEPAFSKVEVFDADGKRVDKKDAHVDSSDRKLLIVSLPQLPPGTYKVSWRVVSVDTHPTKGDFKFIVKP